MHAASFHGDEAVARFQGARGCANLDVTLV